MYGLINRVVEDYVSSHHGPAAWKLIEQRLGAEGAVFVNHQQYPDERTYELVAVTSELLDTEPSALMRGLGAHWVGFAASSGYAELLALAGSSLVEFLRNLDSLHARVGASFPDLRPPSFHVSDVEPGGLTLHYHSHRAGLAPFVEGLIVGLAARFDVEVEITHSVKRENSGHDQFRIRY